MRQDFVFLKANVREYTLARVLLWTTSTKPRVMQVMMQVMMQSSMYECEVKHELDIYNCVRHRA